jgi:hypothetical protein
VVKTIQNVYVLKTLIDMIGVESVIQKLQSLESVIVGCVYFVLNIKTKPNGMVPIYVVMIVMKNKNLYIKQNHCVITVKMKKPFADGLKEIIVVRIVLLREFVIVIV